MNDATLVILCRIRDAVAETQEAHYEKGWTAGQPITIAEYESAEFTAYWEGLKARVERAVAGVNVEIAALISHLEGYDDV